ncbi:MAG: LysR family transcriptional regulator [Oscillospiraceae bacterium]
MTVDQLACFLAVAECHSFTEAAKKMFISHSAVSKTISTLESSLGVQLLLRNNRSVSLTPAGELLYERGGHLYQLWMDLEDRVSSIGTNLNGVISVVAPSMELSAMLPLLQKMKDRYPGVNFHINPYTHSLLIYQMIRNGHTDLGFTYSFAIPDEHSMVNHIPLLSDCFCVVAPQAHPFASRVAVSLLEALAQPIVFPPAGDRLQDTPLLRQVHRSFQSGDYQSQDINDCLLQVALGKGIAILPGSAAVSQLPCCQVPISDPIEGFTLDLLWRKDRITPVIERFLELAAAQVAADK